MYLKNRTILSMLAGIFVIVSVSGICYAYTYLTKDQALTEVLGTDCEIVTETERLKGPILEKIKERLGGKLVYYQEGSESAEVASNKKIEFHFAVQDGKKVRVAVIDTEPGKWGPVDFVIAMDLEPRIKTVKVMRYMEKRGRPIARTTFLNQYTEKTASAPLEVGKDITAVSGATISSRAATFAVKKALVMYEECYSGK